MNHFRFRAFAPPASLLTLLALSATCASAQNSASLSGKVYDREGHSVPHAVVRLISDQTVHGGRSWRYTLLGDSLGKFHQDGLAPGAYLVMVFSGGKGSSVLQNIELRSGDARQLDLAPIAPMQIAAISDTSSMAGRHRTLARIR